MSTPSEAVPLAEDEGPLEQRAHDAESAYPKNDQPEDTSGAQEGDMT